MAQHPLAEFLEALERAGELKRITATVDPRLELAEITERVARARGPALLFEQVHGSRLPTVTNLLASRRRICLALGVHDIDELTGRVSELLSPRRSEGWLDRLRRSSGDVAEPRTVRSAACQQVVRLGGDVDLAQLPVLRCWPDESRPAITSGQVFTQSADGESCCVGFYRLEVLAADKLAIHWLDHERIAQVFEHYRSRSRPMPISIVLGGHPRDIVFCRLSNMAAIDPRLSVGAGAGVPGDVVVCRTIEMTVPADADVVLEGRIDPESPPVEIGPCGGPLSHYLLPRQGRAIELTAITERVNPVVPSVASTGPAAEGMVLHDVLLRVSLPLLKLRIPELVDCHVPAAGGTNGFAVVAFRKSYAGQGARVAAALWGTDEFFLTKMIVLVDEGVDVRDQSAVMSTLGAHVDPARDVLFHAACPHTFDHAAADPTDTRRMAIDATHKLPGEHPRRWPSALAMSSEIEELVDRRWGEYGFDSSPTGENG